MALGWTNLPCTRKINNATFSERLDSNFIETPPQLISADQNNQPHPPTAFHPVPAPQSRSTNHVTHPITGRTVSQLDLPTSHDPFDPSTPTARYQDTPLLALSGSRNLTQDGPRPTTCTTQSMATTRSLHTSNSGLQPVYPPPNSTMATTTLLTTQIINNPIFSNQEYQTPASQETQRFPANLRFTPTHQQLAEDIVAQSIS